MLNRNNRNSLKDCLMNRLIVVSGLVVFFVIVSLASPAMAQASTDAVLVMHFDEGSGTIAKDESGYGNDGTIYGATWTTGISGKALSFDGSNDYVSFLLLLHNLHNNPRSEHTNLIFSKNNHVILFKHSDF